MDSDICVQVWSKRACSSFRKTSVSSFHPKGSSSFAIFNMKHYSIYSSDEFHSSKRRSRGPLVAAKKAAEGGSLVRARVAFLKYSSTLKAFFGRCCLGCLSLL